MNATDSRLTCERCHGIGYVSTALGKLPCLACSTSEFVSTGQETHGEQMSDTRKCWSADNENFNCDELGDLLDNNDELEPGMTVYVADAVPPNVAHLCDANDVLDTIACRAGDMAGEYGERCAEVGDAAVAELNALLADWIRKHCDLSFWTVRNAQEYVLTEADFPTSEVVSNHQEMSGEQG